MVDEVSMAVADVTRARSSANWVTWAVGACFVLSASLLLWKIQLFFHDDAFISLRYARHLALDGELASQRSATNPCR